MSNIPKFRAWDIKNEVMCWVNNINFRKQEVWIEADNGDHETRHTLTRKFDEIVFMQSTGSKDKNGVEIYEGDIVSYTSSIMAKNEWHKKITRYGSALVMASFDDKTRDSAELLNLLSIHKGIEVLGNIYQNPELLEES